MSIILIGIPEIIRAQYNSTKRQKQQKAEIPKDIIKEKKLFLSDPTNISNKVKVDILKDVDPCDKNFEEVWTRIKNSITYLSGASSSMMYTCIPMPGSDLSGPEAVLSSVIPKEEGKVLILENGPRGKQHVKICEALRISYHHVSFPEHNFVRPVMVNDIIQQDQYTAVIVTLWETSYGMTNPVEDIGKIIKQHLPDCVYIVDSNGAVGGVTVNMTDGNVDYLVASSSGCLQALPGLNLVVCNHEHFRTTAASGRCWSLSLWQQYSEFTENHQYLNNPPSHLVLALNQAIKELDGEGGISGRMSRYKTNRDMLTKNLLKLGFTEVPNLTRKTCFFAVFNTPDVPNFVLNTFIERLKQKGHVIGISCAHEKPRLTFNVAGHVTFDDVSKLIQCVEATLKEMKITTPIREI